MKVVLSLITLCFYSSMSFAQPTSQPSNAQIPTVKDALRRYLCFEVYWYGWNRNQSVPLPLRVKVEGGKFFAWIEAAEVSQGDQVDLFIVGRLKGDSAAVVFREGYNVRLMSSAPGYNKNRSIFDSADVIRDTITIPNDCVPRYDVSNSQKERMLNTVVSTMEKHLSWLVRERRANFSRDVTLIIANFNVDYPETWVLVEPSDSQQFSSSKPADLYSVTLHDPQDYDSDKYEVQGEYPSAYVPIKPYHKAIIDKVRKHGIVRKIVFKP